MQYLVAFKNIEGKIGKMTVDIEDGTPDSYQEAIMQVKEHLVQTGEGYDGAVLALIP